MSDKITVVIESMDLNHAAMNRDVTPYSEASIVLKAMREAMPDCHYHKCRDCGNTAIHVDSVTPWVLCRKCGSQDTRRVKT